MGVFPADAGSGVAGRGLERQPRAYGTAQKFVHAKSSNALIVTTSEIST